MSMRTLAITACILAGMTAAHAQPPASGPAAPAVSAVSAPSAAATPQKECTMSARTHTVDSRYGFRETITRLEQAIQAKGMKVFARIDHQAAAQEAGLQMQPATVLIFGAPKAGTPLMVKDPALALQLPLRVLVTEVGDKAQVVFNDTRALIEGSRIAWPDVENSLARAEGLIRQVVTGE